MPQYWKCMDLQLLARRKKIILDVEARAFPSEWKECDLIPIHEWTDEEHV